jgi:hypothetical protein
VTPGSIVRAALTCALIVLNLGYWWLVSTRGAARAKAYVESRYGVVVTIVGKGYWRVTGSRSRVRDWALSWLQLGYYMTAFVVWAAGMLLYLGVESMLWR